MKKIIVSLILLIVLSLSSCSISEKKIEINNTIPVGEYKMHQGDVKKIKGCRYYYKDNDYIVLHFVDAKGTNLDNFVFKDSYDYEESYITISCVKKIENLSNITELIYKDDYSNTSYIYKIDISIYNDEDYSELEPTFVNIDLALSQGELFMIQCDSIKVGFGRNTITKSKKYESSILKNVRLDTNLAKIISIRFTNDRSYFLHDETDDSLLMFDNELDFSVNDYIVIVSLSNCTDTLVYFDLIFDIEYCGEQFSIRRNMSIF